MQRLLLFKNYKYYNLAYCLFYLICIILIIFLPTVKIYYKFTNVYMNNGIMDTEIVSGIKISSIYSIMKFTFTIISNSLYKNLYSLQFVLSIFTILSLVNIFVITILKINKSKYLFSILSFLFYLPILSFIAYLFYGNNITKAELNSTFTNVTYVTIPHIAFYISILLLILNIASIIIEFKYRKIIPAYNFDIKQYLPKRTPKPPKPPKPHKPTKSERIAELERQVKELQNKD